MTAQPTIRMLINGALTAGDKRMPIINPALGTPFTDAPDCTRAELDATVAAARAAFPAWRDTPIEERRAKLRQFAARVSDKAEEVATLLTQEQGKPLSGARGEVATLIRFLKEQPELELPVVVNEESDKRISVTRRVPLGVVAALSPWNFPVLLAWWKVIPALLAGNTVILKPAPQTPLAVLRIAELVADILPPGVLNVIAGGDDLGPWMTSHPGVDKVSFTGSTQTGKRVMVSAAPTMKRLTLELGGNDPAIVLPDVDVEKTAQALFWVAFTNSGQICIASKRIYVHESIYDRFMEALAAVAATVKVGDGLDPATHLGPIQNRAQYDRVRDLIADCRDQGYRIRFEGKAPNGPGYFLPVTIVENPPDGSRIVEEEQFGPILPIMSYSSTDEAIERANNSPYGLGASVWTKDLDLAQQVAGRLDAGTVWINEALYLSPQAAFGGRKESGLGAEHGIESLLSATDTQTVVMRRG